MSMTFLSKHITEFTFPDGQPHIKIERFNEYVTCRITNGDDLVKVCLLLDTYCKAGKPIDLMVLYTMGERMDRQISEFEPCTTDVVSAILRNWSAKPNVNITILSPHSSAILDAVNRVDRQRHDIETEMDQEVFLMITRHNMSEDDIDVYFDKKIDNRKTPIKIAALIVLLLACASTLLFLFTGV